ncbi:hypothetical protein DIPPA_08294 [Diplonema papillatum]|nr:hypothetical protein DIPPA_08294 [Diplonema papillatum]
MAGLVRNVAQYMRTPTVDKTLKRLEEGDETLREVSAEGPQCDQICASLEKLGLPFATAIRLKKCNLSQVALDQLCRGIRGSNLQALALESHAISEDLLPLIASVLPQLPQLSQLSLSGNDLRSIAPLTEYVAATKSLTRLDLSYNKLGGDLSLPFVEALRPNKSITDLNLSHNDLGPKFAQALSVVIFEENVTLLGVKLRGNVRLRDEVAGIEATLLKNAEDAQSPQRVGKAAGGGEENMSPGLNDERKREQLLLDLRETQDDNRKLRLEVDRLQDAVAGLQRTVLDEQEHVETLRKLLDGETKNAKQLENDYQRSTESFMDKIAQLNERCENKLKAMRDDCDAHWRRRNDTSAHALQLASEHVRVDNTMLQMQTSFSYSTPNASFASVSPHLGVSPRPPRDAAAAAAEAQRAAESLKAEESVTVHDLPPTEIIDGSSKKKAAPRKKKRRQPDGSGGGGGGGGGAPSQDPSADEEAFYAGVDEVVATLAAAEDIEKSQIALVLKLLHLVDARAGSSLETAVVDLLKCGEEVKALHDKMAGLQDELLVASEKQKSAQLAGEEAGIEADKHRQAAEDWERKAAAADAIAREHEEKARTAAAQQEADRAEAAGKQAALRGELNAVIDELRGQLKAVSEAREDGGRDEAEWQGRAAVLSGEKAALEQAAAALKQRAADLDAHLATALAAQQSEVAAAERNRAAHVEERNTLEADLSAARTSQSDMQRRAEAAEAAASDLQAKLADAEKANATGQAALAKLEAEHAANLSARQDTEAALAEAQRALSGLVEGAREREETDASLAQKIRDLEAGIAAGAESQARAEELQRKAAAAAAAHAKTVEDLESQLLALETEKTTLADKMAAAAAPPEAAQQPKDSSDVEEKLAKAESQVCALEEALAIERGAKQAEDQAAAKEKDVQAADLEELKAANRKLEKEKTMVEVELHKFIKENKLKRDKLEKQLKDKDASVVEQASKLRLAQEELEQLTAQIQRFKTSESHAESELDQLRSGREETGEEIKKLRDTLTQQQEHFDAETEKRNRQIEELESKLKEGQQRRSPEEGEYDYEDDTESCVSGVDVKDWQDSSKVKTCTRCTNKFTLTNRKHHCRRCGKVFCGKCCSASQLTDNKRVCIDCNQR